jgi:2-polyprenyl-3-methyl-5-hydroxy-6-metoxy-1,4-benzoquinol methylase
MEINLEKLEKTFLAPTIGRELVLKRVILKAVGQLKGKFILDVGCGSGYWTRFFQSRGAECVGIDRSPEQIKLAKSLDVRDIQYIVSDVAAFNSKKKFDIVFIDHVLSETSSRKKAVHILKGSRKALKKKGFIILNEMHPAVAHFPFRKLKTVDNYFYFQSGAPFIFKVKQINGKHTTMRDYHWTLEDFSSFLEEAKFFIESIIEPRPPDLKPLNSYLRKKYRYPSHIIIKAVPK